MRILLIASFLLLAGAEAEVAEEIKDNVSQARLSNLMALPVYVSQKQSTSLQFTVAVTGIPRNQAKNLVIELESLDRKKQVEKNWGRFYDDGQNGDLAANDGNYRIRIDFKEDKLGFVSFRARLQESAGSWSPSPIESVEVQPADTISQPRTPREKLQILQHPKYGKVIANNIMISVRAGTLATKVIALAQKTNCKIIQRINFDIWLLEAEADTVQSLDQAIQALKNFPEITNAEPNYLRGISSHSQSPKRQYL